MKKTLALLVVLAVLLAGWWFSGPYLAVHGLSRAIERRDVSQLDRYVDFPRVRASLRAQLNDHLLRRAGPDIAAGPFGALLHGLGDQLGGAALDTLLTPLGIGAMLQGHLLWQRGRNELQGESIHAPVEPARPLQDAHHRFGRLDRLVLEIARGPDPAPPQGGLEPQGLRWRVVDVQLALQQMP